MQATRRRWIVGALAALALLLGGCFRYDAAITVHEDGTGDVVTLIAVQDALMADLVPALVQRFGANPFTDLEDSDLPPGGTVKTYRQDGFTGLTVTIPFPADDDLSGNAQFAMGTAAGIVPSPIDVDSFILQREDGGWRFHADLVDGSTFVGQDMTTPEAKAALAEATYNLRLSLPGHVVHHNADEVRGGQLIWHIDLNTSDPRTIEAVSQKQGIEGLPPVGLVWLFALLGAAILLTGGAAVQIWRMRD